jgi:hypothetical protein
MVISTIDWRLIFVNQYYNFLMVVLGEKRGQLVQALLQLDIRSRLVKNRFKLPPIREVKRLQEAILPALVEFGNEFSEVQKHFIPIFAADILLRVNEVLEKSGGKIHEL